LAQAMVVKKMAAAAQRGGDKRAKARARFRQEAVGRKEFARHRAGGMQQVREFIWQNRTASDMNAENIEKGSGRG